MVPGAGVDRVEQRDPDVVDQIEGAERLWQLKAAGQAEPGALVRDQPVELPPVEHDAAGLVVQRAAQAVDERRFARAVWADQAEPLARGDRQIDALEGDKPAEPFAKAGDAQDRVLAHAADRCSVAAAAAASTAPARLRRRAWTNPTMPLGAMMTKAIKSNPTISRFSAEDIVTVASC